jgi:putative transposase
LVQEILGVDIFDIFLHAIFFSINFLLCFLQGRLYSVPKKTQPFVKQFMKGEPLFGKNGAFAPLLQSFLQAALDSEMEDHLTQEARNAGNKRNGRGKKTLKTSQGSVEIEPPQDRLSSFQPQIVKKRETILADNLEKQIIGLYGLGTSFRDISKHSKKCMILTSLTPF